jgi:4-hydroxyphenylpyruvate dioxygenase
MKLAIATVSIGGTFEEKLAAIAAAGFDGIEIFEIDFLAFDGSPREVGQMVRDRALEIALFQPFRDFEGMPEPQRQKIFDRARRKFELMQEIGAPLMLVCSNVSPIALGGIDRAAADFAELGDLAAAHGIRVGYEALAWGRHINDHRDAWEIVRRADHPSIGLILDSFHTLARNIDVETIRSIPADRIFFVQLADAPLIAMDLLYWSRHFRSMPGEGDLDVIGFMRAVAATGYNGILSLEIFNDQFRGGSPRSIAVDGRRSLINLMDRVRREEPRIAIEVPPMPDRITVVGVEFIEFAAGETEADELAALLETMGFARVARHINKDVVLYRQGGINVVLNTEKEGMAYSSYIAHGANAYAIGLRVEDARATVARARTLGAEPFEQRHGPGELTIPAIRGVAGGVIYFIDDKSELDRVWQVEFDFVADPSPTGAGLAKVDHLAQTMNYEEMLTWLLFYTAIFRTTKTPLVDIVDPGGLVRSQVVESADGSLRLTLNGAETRKTLAGHFVAESFGSSIQHVAFASDDIFETARRLEGLGFRPLTISKNYYDDLEARLSLDPDLTRRLRTDHILYDRDDNGEFFQLYSQNYGDGFFFEVVERRNGYAGYGATNAPFRIAAQQRSIQAGLSLKP